MSVPRPRKATHESLGSYEVVGRLGGGGMAEVFLATQKMASGVERPVVIKAMLAHLAGDEDVVEMFLREARIAAMLAHPNIVQIFDVPVIGGRPCMVMEYLRGRDLGVVMKRLIRRGERVPADAAAAVIAQAASGLHYAHRLRDARGEAVGLVHRDVSPQNLFLTRDGHVRVVDFGIAKTDAQKPLTQDGALKGKVGYMAPEQARHTGVDARADQWALGVVFWEVLAGKRLFSRDDPLATLDALFHSEILPPSSARPQLPPELDTIVLRMLQREPDGRFASCEEVAGALREWLRARRAEPEETLIARLLERAVPPEEDGKLADGTRPEVVTALGERTSQLADSDLEPVQTAPADVLQPASGSIRRAPELAPAASTPAPEQATFASPPPYGETPRAQPRRESFAWGAAAAILALGLLVFAFIYIFNDGRLPRFDPGTAPRPVAAPLETGQERTADPADDFRHAIEIEFVDVPEGAVIEVDGAMLPSYRLETMPSTDVRTVRVLREGRELGRWQGVFRETRSLRVEPIAVKTKIRRRRR